jgi:UDP-N-acetyl-D-galactosamine dehydrogenase
MNISEFISKNKKICIVGLGYVGLPLAELMARKYKIVGFDIKSTRISELKAGEDKTNEVSSEILKSAGIEFTDDAKMISKCSLIIVAVPTPIDKFKKPDLTSLKNATETVGKNFKKKSVIVYESTVYPGVTEDICIPILEKESGLSWKKDFYVGYSPERVNPGDKKHTIDKIKKVVSGDSTETRAFLEEIYGSVITAGIHLAPTIKTAEAAKVIENTQRDLNIALINELSLIFERMDIDTQDVLAAAGSKWNFLKFKPGLVGGHCIGVDPYYLTFKAESTGYHPQIILAGRRINDNMGKHVAENTVKNLIQAGNRVKGSKVLILGLTFKENIGDIRNTKVVDVYNELKEYGIDVYVHDPYVLKDEVKQAYGIDMIPGIENNAPYNAVIFAVNHKRYLEEVNYERMIELMGGKNPILIDVKAIFNRKEAEDKGFLYWRL